MNTNTKIALAAIVGVIIGVVGVVVFCPRGDVDVHHSEQSSMQKDMDGMMQVLNGKSSDEFDRAFLSEMIVHHQGAVHMAQAALQNAKHQEIKDLAQNIISAQNDEIQKMQDWQRSWYGQ